MRSLPRTLLIALIAPLVAQIILSAATPAPLREEFLAAFAAMDGGPVDISPDGRHVAYAFREKGETAVYVVEIDSSKTVFRTAVGREKHARLVGNTRHTDAVRVVRLDWADNDRVVVATSANHFLVLNHRAKEGRHLINLNGEEQVLGPEFGFLAGQSAVKGRSRGRIVAVSCARPGEVLIEAVASGGLDGSDQVVFRLNIETGRSDVVYKERTPGSLVFDATGGLRARFSSSYWPGAVFLHGPDLGRDKWQPLEKKFPVAFTPAPPLKAEHYFGERSFPLGFDGDVLVYASNRGRKTFGIYGLDLMTGQPTSLVVEDDAVDLVGPFTGPVSDMLVVDRTTRRMIGIHVQGAQASTSWFEPQLAALQTKLEARARGYSVRIVGWDDARARFVVELHHRADPGGYYLYSPENDKLQLVVPRSTRQKSLPRVTITAWALPRPEGVSLSGWLVTPAGEAAAPRPVVVRLQTVPWFRATNGYSPEVLALAQMGFAVLELNHRGISGFGTSHLQAGRHGPEEVAVEDIVAALEALPPASGVNPRRVALLGEDYGGFLALRALQLQPGRFVAAVTREPITDLASWMAVRMNDSDYYRMERAAREWLLGTDKAQWRAHSPVTHAASSRVPVFIAGDPNSFRERWGDLGSFRRKLVAAGQPPVFVEVTAGVNVPGGEQARLWAQIEEFLKKHLLAE